MQLLLEKEVWEALAQYKNEEYKKDPWLWDLDWKPGPRRGTKKPLLLDLVKKLGKEETEFPTWFHALINKDEEGQPYLDISTSKRFVPKVLRLTWKGYPIHFDKDHKWGYLVPSNDIKEIIDQINMGEIDTDFPLAEFLDSISQEKTDGFRQSTDIFVDEVVDYSGFVRKVDTDLPDPKDAKHVDIPGRWGCVCVFSFSNFVIKEFEWHNASNYF
jgi:DNA polymerase gamma 1